MFLRLPALGLLLLLVGVRAAELPPRPADAPTGSAVAARVAALDRAAREAAVVAEVRRGNVPAFWRRFVEVPVSLPETFLPLLDSEGGASLPPLRSLGADEAAPSDPKLRTNSRTNALFWVAPDYLAVGSDDDYLLMPLTPATAQLVADDVGCVLPTRKMVDAIYRTAPLKLEPSPIPPSAAMTTMPVFARHNATVREQRVAALAVHPPGTLVAGHKKDVVITPRLATSPGKVAIYGWHRPDGTAIQPLYLGHTADWVDYSHGVRLVRRTMTVDDRPTTIDAVLADPKLCALLSDEGPVAHPRYGEARPPAPAAWPAEKTEEMQFDAGVRVVLNAPATFDPAKPVRLVLYALPAGNTIEQTIGRRLRPGDDWHFDIQHIGAQTRWLRLHAADANLVVVYLQPAERSWVLWRRQHADHARRIGAIVDALRRRYPAARLVLTGHSAGGAFTFGYLDGIERIPEDVERIAFLDSNYAYDAAKGHAAKLAQWFDASAAHRLVVLAYEDHVALLNGKTFVSASGGTWGRSQAMLSDLGAKFAFARQDAAGLQRHTALAGRVQFLLKENPEKAVLHTRQVEWNGFIHALCAGTEHEDRGYAYLGPRAYGELIADE
jgi:hypothetical protein